MSYSRCHAAEPFLLLASVGFPMLFSESGGLKIYSRSPFASKMLSNVGYSPHSTLANNPQGMVIESDIDGQVGRSANPNPTKRDAILAQ